MRQLYALLVLAGCSATSQAPIPRPQTEPDQGQHLMAGQITITNNPRYDSYYEETHASWAALQDLSVGLQHFHAAYSAVCRAPDMFDYVDAESHGRHQRLLRLEDEVNERLSHTWIDHPGGPQRVDTRLRLYWEDRTRGRYEIPLNHTTTQHLVGAHAELLEELRGYHALREQAALEGVHLSLR